MSNPYNYTADTLNVSDWGTALAHAGNVAREQGRVVSIWSARSRTLIATVGPSGRVVTHR